jgi:hypothetical protein
MWPPHFEVAGHFRRSSRIFSTPGQRFTHLYGQIDKESFGARPKPDKVVTPTYLANSMADFVHQVRIQDA